MAASFVLVTFVVPAFYSSVATLLEHNVYATDPFQWGSKVSTNRSNTWKHACYWAFMYTFTEKHVCFHVMCT